MFELFDQSLFDLSDWSASVTSDLYTETASAWVPDESSIFETPSPNREQAGFIDAIKNLFRDDSVLSPSDLHGGGTFDSVNNCIVEGDVLADMSYVDGQTANSCSLMAQEQFVERWVGKNIPEHVLEEIAASWGVYTPEGGTNFAGQDAILDYFGVPHQRYPTADLQMLEEAIANGNDAILGVDARDFYHDPTIPPQSGHAVSVVGRGIDPVTGETKGFYFTDSNYPQTARFVTAEELTKCWLGDMIVVNTDVQQEAFL